MPSDGVAARRALAEIATLEATLAETRARVLNLESARQVDLAAAAYRERRIRDACFGDDSDLFGEPVWDMLLDLYSARMRGVPVSVSSACIAAHVPNTTALRYIAIMETRGLVSRRRDDADARRVFVEISDRAMAQVRAWLERST